jgi:hypothetical protein
MQRMNEKNRARGSGESILRRGRRHESSFPAGSRKSFFSSLLKAIAEIYELTGKAISQTGETERDHGDNHAGDQAILQGGHSTSVSL